MFLLFMFNKNNDNNSNNPPYWIQNEKYTIPISGQSYVNSTVLENITSLALGRGSNMMLVETTPGIEVTVSVLSVEVLHTLLASLKQASDAFLLMLTNLRDAFSGQSRSTNIVPFLMLGSFLLCFKFVFKTHHFYDMRL